MPYYDQDKGIAREHLCRYLAACYYQPGPEFAEEKVFDSMLDAANRIHPDLAKFVRGLRYQRRDDGNGPLRQRIIEMTHRHRRHGYRMIHLRLRMRAGK